MLAALLFASCSFLRTATTDPYDASYEELTTEIKALQDARASGVRYAQWANDSLTARIVAHEIEYGGASDSDPDGDKRALSEAASWDLALATLHARRASALARRTGAVSFTDIWLRMVLSDFRRDPDRSWLDLAFGGVGVLLVVPFAVVADVVVVVPVSFCVGAVQDFGVDGATRERVEADLERARSLGLERADQWMR